MKKLFIFSLVVLSFFYTAVNAGWYGLNSVSYSGTSKIGDCGSTYCETIPHVTICPGDNLPSGDTTSAVQISGAPTFQDNPSNNTYYNNTISVAANGTMNCFYRDYIKFDVDTYELYDYSYDNYGIADGVEKNIKIDFQINGEYNGVSSFVPLNDANNGINTINFTLVFQDKTDLDQYSKSGTAVYPQNVATDSSSGDTRTITYSINSSNIANYINGGNEFIFKYKFYNSTIGDAITTANNFVLKTLRYNVTLKGGSSYNGKYIYSGDQGIQINNISVPIKIKPLYEITNNGEIFNKGFVEGRIQTGSIDITRNSNLASPSNRYLFFVETGTGVGSFTASGIVEDTYNPYSKPNILIGSILKNFTLPTNTYFLKTLFGLVGSSGFLDDIKYFKVLEYLKYSLDGKDISYLAGVLNEGNTNNYNTLKIYGITNIDSSKQLDLQTNQDESDIQNLNGDITKSTLKQEIRKDVINTVKFLPTSSYSDPIISNLLGTSWNATNNGYIAGDILYLGGLNGELVKLNSPSKLTGKKTIVVRGGDLYISGNIINNTSSDMLGIVVLQDDNGKGGKIYVDTSVQEIDAIIYSDKSLISYNQSYDNGDSNSIIKHEVDGNIDNAVMQNQLYIYGSVFSENTIGGSRLNPSVCPYYTKNIAGFVCDSIEAQKYDLNYLRGGINNKYSSSYPDYPIVIKYNSLLQSSPPPLFKK